jgi:hypothetical protein
VLVRCPETPYNIPNWQVGNRDKARKTKFLDSGEEVKQKLCHKENFEKVVLASGEVVGSKWPSMAPNKVLT